MTTATLPTDAVSLRDRVSLPPRSWLVPAAVGLLFAFALVRTAWLCDDAYITFRTVDNFVHGYGLRWNVAERVQTFTNPLWMLLTSALYAVTHEIYYTSLVLSMLLSLGVVTLLLACFARQPLAALLAGAVLVGSRAFVDFSTSGLENPLSHGLLLCFLILYDRSPGRRSLLSLSLLAGLAVVNRADHLLLFLPPLLAAAAASGNRWSTWRDLALGFLPVLLWEAFSMLYYGFPFPNTFYAKLPDSVGLGARIEHGLQYFNAHWTRDPITPVVVLAGILLPLALRSRRWIPVALGIAVYVGYVIQVGGDFMLGRFLAAPLLASLVIVLRCLETRPRGLRVAAVAAAVVLACLNPAPPLASTSHYGKDLVITGNPVHDERSTYYQCTGLLRANRSRTGPEHWSREKAEQDRARGVTHMLQHMVGFYGFYAGPGIYVLDRFALGDALLARIPVVNMRVDLKTRKPVWAAGHLVRSMPAGYQETLLNGPNVIESPELARVYDALRLVTRGPLLDAQRWREIWKLNTGAYGADLAAYGKTVSDSGPRFAGLPIYVFHAAWDRFQEWAGMTQVSIDKVTPGSPDPARWADEIRGLQQEKFWVVVPVEPGTGTPTAEAREFLEAMTPFSRQETPFSAEGLMAYLFILQ